MRLVINSRNCNAGAGLNRYKGVGIYSSIGRKHTGLQKVTNNVERDEADADDLVKKSVGKGINVSSMEDIDAVDSSSIDESTKVDSDKDPSMEVNSNSSNETVVDKDKEIIVDDEQKSAHDEESNVDDEKKSAHDDEESIQNDEELKEKSDEETLTSAVKRKYPPSVIDFLINNNTDDSAISVPTKLQCLDFSISDFQENYVPTIAEPQPDLTNHDSWNYERMSKKSTNHHLSLIYPTEGKKWPQKKCVYCRRKYGIRNDTRYFCIQCNVGLCKKPCFSDYHCNK